MKNRIFYLLLLAVGCYGTGAHAQSLVPSTLNASGGSKTISGNTYEYSIGEMMLVSTVATPNLVVTQGILQPSDRSTGISDIPILAGELNVFPNPFKDIIYIRPNWKSGGQLSIRVTDITGREILHKAWELYAGNEQQSIQLGGLAAGSYLLQARFTQGSAMHYGVFKLQKTN